ncbi:GTP cyclohydrolase II [Boseongicola aestuarii]|uniref:GTP cyclohydrolase-2 n=1 Tax=Boseongicola aestuarii TaxID=1470561 RepID=A0A238IZ60_9RHOB|nr:GTP cyclohydrolase II [Boseongicola aestuarii]SMX23272.1 GTP cyclohydrolase-2 [Boseongicola aestuarii]
MTLVPSLIDRIARARTDLRLGLPVVLRSKDAAALVLAAEGLSNDRLSAARTLGPATLAITTRRAETLRARAYDGDIARVKVPETADAAWVRHVADPKDDLSSPMKGPFTSIRDGDADLHRLAVRLVKSAWLLPAAIVVPLSEDAPPDLTLLPTEDTAAALSAPIAHKEVVTGRVPIAVSEQGRVHVFRPTDGSEEHIACEIGRPARDKPVLARLHSACFTGDVLGSLKCDCGAQLQAALRQMGEEGAGVLLYLNQEGRGIGLANKMRAYALQDQGFDTVEANHRLGFEDDERDFRTGADILKRLGFGAVRLLTNNPAKVAMMQAQGIDVVERVPLSVGLNPLNKKYLDVKAKKSGHIL